MNNGCEPEDHEEVVGENHHNDDGPPHEGTIYTLSSPFNSQLDKPHEKHITISITTFSWEGHRGSI